MLYGAWEQADLKKPVPLVAVAAQMWIQTSLASSPPAPPLLHHQGWSMPRVFHLVSHIPRVSSQVSAPPRTPEIQVKLETMAMKLRGLDPTIRPIPSVATSTDALLCRAVPKPPLRSPQPGLLAPVSLL